MRDDKTEHRGYLLPHADNDLETDVERLRVALGGIDDDVNDAFGAFDSFVEATEAAMSKKASLGEDGKIDVSIVPTATPDTPGIQPLVDLQLATDAEASAGTATDVIPNVKQVADGIAAARQQIATSGYRNAIINGAMEFAQRATTYTGTGYGSLDRWRTNLAATLAQINSLPTGVPGATSHMRLTATSTNGMSVAQRIENAAIFSGERATVSFWAKASKIQAVKVTLTRSAGGTIALSQSANLTTSWQRYELTFDVPTLSARPNPTTTYLQLEFAVSGTAVGDYVDLTMVQMESGDAATPFERRNYGDEEHLCMRYYEAINCHNTVNRASPCASWGSNWDMVFHFEVPKRARPSVVISNASFRGIKTGATGNPIVNLTLIAQLSPRHLAAQTGTALPSSVGSVTELEGYSSAVHFRADAEL